MKRNSPRALSGEEAIKKILGELSSDSEVSDNDTESETESDLYHLSDDSDDNKSKVTSHLSVKSFYSSRKAECQKKKPKDCSSNKNMWDK